MSFFEFMKRMVEGRPVFEDPSASSEPPEEQRPVRPTEPEGPAIRKGDEHSFPDVHITHTHTRLNGVQMEVYCRIVNTWPEEIMLDKIRILNVVRELDDFLGGNREKEFLVYKGPRPSREIHEAELDYKTRAEGDYFRAMHDVEFDYQAEDKTYAVSEVNLHPPIRDIYG